MLKQLKPSFYNIILLLSLFVATSCQQESANKGEDLNKLHSPNSCFAIIEIPAGTNKKLERDEESNKIIQDEIDGKKRVVNFLPYPGNYGYIPNTLLDKSKGGDGDPLDVLIIGESQNSGTKMEVLPIGVLLLKDGGEEDSKLIAIPWDTELRVINATNFATFITEFNAAKQIIQEWFLNYKGLGKTELLGWKDEKFARTLIQKWSKKE